MDASDNGLVHVRSHRSVWDSSAVLEQIVHRRGMNIVAKIDHAQAAVGVGMVMRPTQLLIFGNPSSGTPVMLASPSAAIDLPLKILVWEDAAGRVWLSYNDTGYLQQRHGLSEELMRHIDGVGSICREATAM